MGKKLLFVGAGAIGSYLGSFLSRAGHEVTLIDPWAEQVDTINRQGISVTGPHDPFRPTREPCTSTMPPAYPATSTSASLP